MSENTAEHPERGLIIEARIERALSNSPEAQALQEDIFKAVQAYVDFLHRHNRIWQDGSDPNDIPRLKAQALVVTADFGDGCNAIDITLKDGALDRVYGKGVNPDPWGRDADPPP
jgi:hypothetical protein